MKRKLKLWIFGSSAFAAASVALVAASCVKPVSLNKQYVFEYNSPLTNSAFGFDASRTFGSYSSSGTWQYTGGELIRLQPLNEAELFTELIDEARVMVFTKKPVFARYHLELAKAIILTDANGEVSVFDNDSYDSNPQPDSISPQNKPYYRDSTIKLTSNDERSVNSIKFDETLKKAKKFQIVLKDNLSWVNSKGEKTKYQVVPKDYWYSWLRTYSLNATYRNNKNLGGGSDALDKKFRDLLAQPNTPVFTPTESYNNDYLYRLFGIEVDNFFEKDKFVQKISDKADKYQGEESITFEGMSSTESQFSSFFDKLIIDGDYTFMPAPSQFIDESNETKSQLITTYIGEKIAPSDEDDFRNDIEKLDHSKAAYFTGAYWYGVSQESTLYAGPYYISEAKNSRQVMKKNQNYWDTEWVKADDTVDELVYSYQSSPIEAKLFSDTSFNKYSQGTVTEIAYSTLSATQKSTIARNAKKFGLRQIRRKNDKSPFYRMVTTPFVNSGLNNYGFNDAYAKIMWGKTVDEINKGNIDPTTFISGTGLSFRTILHSAINWDTYASIITSGQSQSWVAKVPDGSNINGSDQSTAKIKVTEDVADQINALSAIDVDGNKIDFGSDLGKMLLPSKNQEAVKNKANTIDKLKSAGFLKLQEEMKRLIDKFDKDNPSFANQKFEIYYFFPFTNVPDTFLKGWNEVMEVAKQLNPRIEVKVKYFTNATNPEFNKWRFSGVNGSQIVSWTNDYNGIGSSYDGLSWSASLIPTLIKIHNDNNEKFKKSFPRIHELVESLIKHEKENPTNFSIPFLDLDKIDTKWVGQEFTSAISEYEFKLNPANKKYEAVLVDGKPKHITSKDNKPITEPYTWSSIFWLQFNRSKTNAELTELMQEIATFVPFDFTFSITKGRDTYGKQLINSQYIVPNITGSSSYQFQEWKIKKGN
ncbi:OppA family ABC transporter substrate-binding lipoprotein [Mycoplasma phocoeninasale]|uniref:OppA family ABC transporter substrate-binding lipoprotein n=1 Tax=Mycoplasma phocoeninasale TaxID=2726117 RepID=UPI00196811F3|nr:oligopeptide ABC transporter substrate-binding protein [Mycoplasma phocoeninasale]MBN0970741.1 oligopeptide ABC transporter substrate-binding protein [Mycoplasma phocoeninasale]